jgi:hypothetical protein
VGEQEVFQTKGPDFVMVIACYVVHIFSPPGTVMLAVITSYLIGTFSDLYVGSGLRLQPRRETR